MIVIGAVAFAPEGAAPSRQGFGVRCLGVGAVLRVVGGGATQRPGGDGGDQLEGLLARRRPVGHDATPCRYRLSTRLRTSTRGVRTPSSQLATAFSPTPTRNAASVRVIPAASRSSRS